MGQDEGGKLSERLAKQVQDIIDEQCSECHKPYTTLREVAKEMHVSPSTLSRWLAGKNQPSAHLLDMADAFVIEEATRVG